jgi:hypothetical protein
LNETGKVSDSLRLYSVEVLRCGVLKFAAAAFRVSCAADYLRRQLHLFASQPLTKKFLALTTHDRDQAIGLRIAGKFIIRRLFN